jgi:ElaA protein
MTSSASWRWHRWDDLDPDTLHAFLKLRSDVFVVEQNCVFSDMDGLDPQCEHLCGFDESGGLAAYLRLLPPGLKSPEPSIGRLVVAQHARKHGLGRAAMQEGMAHCRARYPGQPIFLSAQEYLQHFYGELGFETISDPYLDDGILHVNMRISGPSMS